MNSSSRLSLGQRVVVVVGLAAVLGVIASFATAAGTLTGWMERARHPGLRPWPQASG